MARHTRANDHNEEASQPRSASDLLRAAGYDLPDKRRRRRERNDEPAAPEPVQRTMFPYRRPTEAERARPASETQPAALARPAAPTHPVAPIQPVVRAQPTPITQPTPLAPLGQPQRAGGRPAARVQPEQARAERSQPERLRAERNQPERAQPARPPFGEPSRAATRWAPDRTGPQTGPHTWPPLAPARGTIGGTGAGPVGGPAAGHLRGHVGHVGYAGYGQPVAAQPAHGRALPGIDEPPRLAPVQHLPSRQHEQDTPPHRLPSAVASPAGAQVRAAPAKRAVRPEYDERPLDRRRAKAVPGPVEEENAEPAAERSLLRAWTLFLIETLLAAGAGLGLWLGFHTLWSLRPLYAAGGCAVVLVVMHVVAGLIRRRQTGGEYDLFTSAAVTAVGVAITVLPAAFVIHPGG